MAANEGLTTSDFYCTECGNKGIPIMRRPGGQREAGHLKNLYCIHCRKETNHAEIRPFGSYTYEDFEMEFRLGRFVQGKKTAIADLPICKEHSCEYCVNGRCWNTNGSYICEHRNIKIEGDNYENKR